MPRRLIDTLPGERVRILSFSGGWSMRARLFQMGIHPGDIIRVIRAGPLGGPLYIENLTTGGRVALGRGIASKILVE